MKDQPLVSILINNYNYGRFLSDAIESALGQTYPRTEVVVVDDGSTDNSREVIARYEDRVVSVLKENGGQASAFNAGFAASRGDVVCFLDADDVFLPEKAAQVAAVLAERPDTGWCFHRVRQVDLYSGETLRLHPQDASFECDLRSELRKGRVRFPSPPTAGLCFRRDLLARILPMPEGENVAISDEYLRLTAFALAKGFYLASPLALLRVHGGNVYSWRKDKQVVHARIQVLTAFWLRAKLPELSKYTNKAFADGIGTFWQRGGIEARYKPFVDDYLASVSPWERVEIGLRALYVFQRGKARDFYYGLRPTDRRRQGTNNRPGNETA